VESGRGNSCHKTGIGRRPRRGRKAIDKLSTIGGRGKKRQGRGRARIDGKRLNDQKLLAAIAGNDADDRGAWVALGKLAPDSEMLAGLARATRADARLWAVWRMEDRSLLDELSRNDPDARVRQAASRKASGNPQSIAKGNIMTLLEEGKILAEITSVSYGAIGFMSYNDDGNHLQITILKLVPWPLEVIVPAGSHFVYENPWYDKGEYGSIVSTVDVTVMKAGVRTLIPVAFANRAKRIPQTDVPNYMRKSDAAPHIACTNREMSLESWTAPFTLRRHPNEAVLKKLMTHPDWKTLDPDDNKKRYYSSSSNPDLRAMQAAVLIVTDDVTHGELASVRVSHSPITEDDMARAMHLCAEAGIDIKQKRIWDDCAKILAGLEAGELKNWLEKFSGLAVPAHGLIQSQALQHPAAVQHQSPI
jgi:hypothetical protein